MRYYPIIKKILFQLEPEKAHQLTLSTIDWLYKIRLLPLLFTNPKTPSKPTTVMGINFANRLGLAAGFDKDGQHLDALGCLGFGFIEIGTVTPRAQPGNQPPRLFRLTQAQALINSMGFNNLGVNNLLNNLQKSSYNGVLGINIGKNFDTPIENAVQDYLYCLEKVYPHASYIVANISSPNTKDLRRLQFADHFINLLTSLKTKQTEMNLKYNKYVPLVIKISPDISEEDLHDLADLLIQYQIDAVTTTNTTISRNFAELTQPQKQIIGGLSGRPLKSLTLRTLNILHKYLANKIPIIAVGGITQPLDGQEYLTAGASLLQIYTGLIYNGPHLVKQILKII